MYDFLNSYAKKANMSIFVVFRIQSPEKLNKAIKEAYPNDSLKVSEGEWLVSASATAKEVATKLGIIDGDTGSAIVFKMDSYYGRAPTDIWDWIVTKSEASE